MRAAVAFVVLVFAVEGVAVAGKHVADSGSTSNYGSLSDRLEGEIPPGTTVVGDNRLWPALRERNYRSWLLLFYDTNPRISQGRSTDVFGAMDRIGPDYLLLSPLSRQILTQLTPKDAADFDRYLATRTEKAGTVADRDYGPIEVYRVTH